MKKKILYVEDDDSLAFLTSDALEDHNFEVYHFKNGKDALEKFKDSDFDICILDVMMPEMDGFTLATELRKIDQEIPILFLTARVMKEDRIKGLRLGADDYIVKPYNMEELILKIEVFLRRCNKSVDAKQSTYQLGQFLFEPELYCLKSRGKEVKLTQRESELLLLLVKNKNKVVKREQILLEIWGDDDYFMGRSLDVFISRLRKIIQPDTTLEIENIHGVGFKLGVK